MAGSILCLLVLLSNFNSLSAFFVGDDFDFLRWFGKQESVRSAFELEFWGVWEPCWYLTFYLDRLLWGLNPSGYHLANLAWLALAVVLLYRLVDDLWPGTRLAPWAAAALFATHPLHDEAVTYLSARGHPMALGLVLLSLWLYVKGRGGGFGLKGRVALYAAALVSGLLATGAKETALTLPLWVAMLEWLVLDPRRLAFRSLLPALGRASPFVLPVAANLLARRLVVGLGSDKLGFPEGGLGGLLAESARDLPAYALIGGLPLPFAFLDAPTVRGFAPFGWLLVAAAVLPGLFLVLRAWFAGRPVSRSIGIYVFGLGLIAVGLALVLLADVGLRRRYFYAPSAGLAIVAAVLFERMASWRLRIARALLILLVAGGAIGLVHRNELYRQSGEVTRDLFETVRGAPLDAAEPPASRRAAGVVLVTLPRYWGGDFLSGAYLLHRTDLASLLALGGVVPLGLSLGLSCYYADDYSATLRFENASRFELVVSFRKDKSYEAARSRPPDEARRGDLLKIVPESEDAEARTLSYRGTIDRPAVRGVRTELYLYSEGGFRRITPPGG